MILPLVLSLTIFYPIVSADPLPEQSNNCILSGPLAENILREYVSSEVGVHKIHTDPKTWNGARNVCLDEGAQLAVIETAAEEAMLMKYMTANNMGSVWIGVHDLFEKKEWTTITGQRLYSLQYTHWRNGEPNGSASGEHCVEMTLGGMNDILCEHEGPFVCEKGGIDIRFGNK